MKKKLRKCLLAHYWRKNNPCSRTCLKCGLEQHIFGDGDNNLHDRWEDMWFVKIK